jgi:hypothetical protein
MKQEKSCYAFLTLETTAIATMQRMRRTQSTHNAVSKSTSCEAPKRQCQKVSTAECRGKKNNDSGEPKPSFPKKHQKVKQESSIARRLITSI